MLCNKHVVFKSSRANHIEITQAHTIINHSNSDTTTCDILLPYPGNIYIHSRSLCINLHSTQKQNSEHHLNNIINHKII